MEKDSTLRHALVRAVPDSVAKGLAREAPPHPLDPVLARLQHERYSRLLQDVGLEVRVLPADSRYPDCCFVEDMAVILNGCALLTRPGAPSRRGEMPSVRQALEDFFQLHEIRPPGKLDGGDVLVAGKEVLVGRSSRTNTAGIRQLEELAGGLGYSVRSAHIRGALHLKSLVTALTDRILICGERCGIEDALHGFKKIRIPDEEAFAANALRLPGERRILIAAGAPETARLLHEAGFDVTEIDLSELRKVDGSLTCLSLLW
ncbi:MAG: arginine deiminase-related protein [Planctomycetota bacterium]